MTGSGRRDKIDISKYYTEKGDYILEEFRKEPVTILLIVLNILVFLAVEMTGSSQDVFHMLNCGASYTPLVRDQGETYRLFTSMFLHFGIFSPG